MSTASSDKPSQISAMSNTLLDKFNNECNGYLNSELYTRLLSTEKSSISAASEYYLTEYQRCIDEQMNFVHYIDEQMTSLDALKSCEIAMDTFIERLKSIHEYELKQNDIFEQILHELTKMNPSNKEERIRLLGQIDELITYKAKLTGNGGDNNSSITKLMGKSSDTFKIIL